MKWHQDFLFWFTIQLKTQGSTWDAALKYSSYFWPSKFWKLTLLLWFNKNKSACPPKCMVEIGKVSLVWQKVSKTESQSTGRLQKTDNHKTSLLEQQQRNLGKSMYSTKFRDCVTQTMFHLYCNGLGRNLEESHITVLDASNTEIKTVVTNLEAYLEVSHQEQWSWACSGHGTALANMQRFIKANDAVEMWVVEAFSRQEWIYASKEVVEKKGTVGKWNRIQTEITNQENNHCSNIKYVSCKTSLCLSLNL